MGIAITERLETLIRRYAIAHKLSNRERQVLLASIIGTHDKLLADQIGCSRGTITTYWKRIFGKIGRRSQKDVVSHVVVFCISDGNSVPDRGT